MRRGTFSRGVVRPGGEESAGPAMKILSRASPAAWITAPAVAFVERRIPLSIAGARPSWLAQPVAVDASAASGPGAVAAQ